MPRKFIYAVVAIVVVLAVYLLWPHSSWSITVTADRTEATPWQTVHLRAVATPADAPKQPLTFAWKRDDVALAGTAADLDWQAGAAGPHVIVVTATDDAGVSHDATITIIVRLKAYVTSAGTSVQPLAAEEAATREPSPLPFSIANVTVEKSEVCTGEQSRIKLTPADSRGPGQQKFLTPVVNGIQAWEVPFVAVPGPPGLRRVPVMLMETRPGAQTPDVVATAVYIEVKDCIAPFPIYLEQAAIPPDAEHIAFSVRVLDGPAWLKWVKSRTALPGAVSDDPPLATPASFRWTFGDGTTGTSTEPRTNHLYPPENKRPSERRTTYTAKVEAIAADGSTMATGYIGVSLVNQRSVILNDYHTLTLLTHIPPGPALTSKDGVRSVKVILENLDSTETAQLVDAKAKYVPCDGKEGTERPITLAAIFHDTTIGPRSTIAGELAVPGADLVGFCNVTIEVTGQTTPGGYDVTGTFALDTGDSPGIVLTKEQRAVLKQARAILGVEGVISADDIHKLEDEGKIPKGVLTADPFAAGAQHAPLAPSP